MLARSPTVQGLAETLAAIPPVNPQQQDAISHAPFTPAQRAAGVPCAAMQESAARSYLVSAPPMLLPAVSAVTWQFYLTYASLPNSCSHRECSAHACRRRKDKYSGNQHLLRMAEYHDVEPAMTGTLGAQADREGETISRENIPSAFRLRGHVNVTALQGAIACLIDRHEVLRAKYVLRHGEVLQVSPPPHLARRLLSSSSTAGSWHRRPSSQGSAMAAIWLHRASMHS